LNAAELYLTCLQQLTQLSEQAEEAARNQNWDGLVATLTQRQEIMTKVDNLPDEARHLTPQQKLQAASLLERIAQMDSMSTAIVDTTMSSTRAVLQDGNQARAGISAYRKVAGTAPQMHEARFVDKNR